MTKQRLNNTEKKTSSTKAGLQDGYDRTTFIVKEQSVKKLKVIAIKENLFLKDVVNKALDQYINSWERRKGELKDV